MNVHILAVECHAPCRIPLKHVDNVTPALAFNSFLAYSGFCRLLITFVNSLVPDHSKPFDTQIVFMIEFLEKGNFEKVSRRQQKHEKLPRGQRVNCLRCARFHPSIHPSTSNHGFMT